MISVFFRLSNTRNCADERVAFCCILRRMKFLSRNVVFFILFLPAVLSAQTQLTPSQQASTKGLKLDTGEEIFKASCIGCHGPNGAGQPQTILGFEPPPAFPDFTDCNGSTRERTADWSAIIHEGGPIRGFSEIMPSWKEALTTEQINKVIAFLRSRCEESAWPLGELNLPRTLFTEKAFPEDEWVLTSAVNTNGSGEVSGELVYEKRFGKRNQLEFAAPYGFIQGTDNGWDGGIGDLVLGYKRVLFARGTSSILSVQGEVIAPTGNKEKGLGAGVTTFETFAAFGQNLPRSSFFQMQTGFELPTDTTNIPNVYYWRGAVGKMFTQNGRVGRAWTPMVEFLADRELETGASTNWDIVPEMQITLSKRQHVRLNVGVRTPMNNTAGRSTQLAFYMLWDFFDGGLREGW
jgi:mono/diheme cytochrome c family protein